jgi:hypothetical protein
MITLFIKYWYFIVIGALMLALSGTGVYINLLKSQKSALVAEKDTLTVLLKESQANLIQLQNDIQFQNDAIKKLKEEGDARVKKGEAAVKQAKDTADIYKKQAGDILSRPAPPGIPKCDAATQLILGELKNERK